MIILGSDGKKRKITLDEDACRALAVEVCVAAVKEVRDGQKKRAALEAKVKRMNADAQKVTAALKEARAGMAHAKDGIMQRIPYVDSDGVVKYRTAYRVWKRNAGRLKRIRAMPRLLAEADSKIEEARRFILSPEFEWYSGMSGTDVLRRISKELLTCGECRYCKGERAGRQFVYRCEAPGERRRTVRTKWGACERFEE